MTDETTHCYVLAYARNTPVKTAWRVMVRNGPPPYGETPDLQKHGFGQAYDGDQLLAFSSKKLALAAMLGLQQPDGRDFMLGVAAKDGSFEPVVIHANFIERATPQEADRT